MEFNKFAYNKTEEIINFFSKDKYLVGTSLLRVCFGLSIIYFYMLHYSHRYYLFSEYGVNIYTKKYKSSVLSLYNLSDDFLFFDLIYNFGIIVAVVFTLGYKGRIFTVLNYVFYSSLYNRMVHIGDGGDNLLYLVFFYMMFMKTTEYFSIDSIFKRESEIEKGKENLVTVVGKIFHNFFVYICIIQLCIVYFISAIFQIMGESWNNGTAIYYISQVEAFSVPGFKDFVFDNIYLSVVLAYFGILIKLFFPFFILLRRIKLLAVFCMVMFHLGIAATMGLISFSLAMIFMELLLFSDGEYKKMMQHYMLFYKDIWEFSRKINKQLSTKYFRKFRIIVLYDGWCSSCSNIIKRIKKIDVFDLIEFISFRGVSDHFFGTQETELEKRMHSYYVEEKRMVNGMDSFIQITKRLPILYIILPLLFLVKHIGLGNRIYDWIARRRMIIPINTCNEDCQLEVIHKANSIGEMKK
ncbi:DCC1-like thiol-disulfide oxidoreductase family protein [Paenibacillus sp. P36]|uniref:DCC1-like thiol-disulfide oxidoreductase family protein n=1 Tax=Paenibacillus sp. P36 TaxID=3342538 RepID=UPI0038B39CF8